MNWTEMSHLGIGCLAQGGSGTVINWIWIPRKQNSLQKISARKTKNIDQSHKVVWTTAAVSSRASAKNKSSKLEHLTASASRVAKKAHTEKDQKGK
jgi:microcompartment protein CcmL/EutN